jgi:hypothetical protein
LLSPLELFVQPMLRPFAAGYGFRRFQRTERRSEVPPKMLPLCVDAVLDQYLVPLAGAEVSVRDQSADLADTETSVQEIPYKLRTQLVAGRRSTEDDSGVVTGEVVPAGPAILSFRGAH